VGANVKGSIREFFMWEYRLLPIEIFAPEPGSEHNGSIDDISRQMKAPGVSDN
jgi:hypothetical protein